MIQAKDGEQAKQRLGAARPLITLIDTPAVGPPSTPAARSRRLAAELKLLEVNEVHLALPATLSAAAADELSEALAPLGADPRRALARGRDQAPGRADRAGAQGRPPAVLRLRPRRA